VIEWVSSVLCNIIFNSIVLCMCVCVCAYVRMCVCVVKDGWTAVHFSVMRGHCDVMMYLVARGASVTHSNIVSQLNILFISVILFPLLLLLS
jgi:hypothetical protein